MKKRFITILLALAILVTLIPLLGIDNAYAASNPYPGNMDSNCTYAAWQKTKDILGIELPKWGNAWTWYSSAPSAGYSVGTTPRANSIVVFKQATWNYNLGHVAFVTEYNSSTGQIYKLEGNYNGSYHEGWAPAWESDMYGYIYLDATQVDDGTAPEIQNAHITAATTTSYDVRFNVYDNSTCTAQVGCWSDKWNIDEAKWYDVSIYGGDYGSITIPIADMGGYKDCWYYCNIYAWDAFGNKSKATTVKVFIDGSAPEIKNAHTTAATTTSYDVRFNVYDNSTCTAQVGCWSDKWNIDEAKWYDVSIYGGDYGSITIPIADMGGYKDCWYYCNIYAWDAFGNKSKATTVKAYICSTHNWDSGTVNRKATATKAGEKTFTCTACKETKTEVIPKVTAPSGKVTILNTVANSAKKTNDVIWDKSKVKDATGYIVEWRARGASKWASKKVGNVIRGVTFGLTIGNLYEIRVTPYKPATATTEEVIGTPSDIVYRYFFTTQKIRLASKSKGTFTMSWAKDPKATSYQVLYTTNSNGAGAAQNIKTAGASATSITVKDIKVNGKVQKLKSGTTYYVQVRAVRTVGGKNYIGNISCPVAVKVK